MYDIVFITYKEEVSSSYYIEDIVMKFPYHRTHWVRGVKGIHNAHKEAAGRVFSKMFYVVDADAKLLPNFKFDTNLGIFLVKSMATLISDLISQYKQVGVKNCRYDKGTGNREQGTGNREQGTGKRFSATLLFVTYVGFFPFTYLYHHVDSTL